MSDTVCYLSLILICRRRRRCPLSLTIDHWWVKSFVCVLLHWSQTMASPTSPTYENQALVLYLLYLVPGLFSPPPLLIGPLFRSELPRPLLIT
jgi:hypothetical protein